MIDQDADEDHVPLIQPEVSGATGPAPVYRQFASAAKVVLLTRQSSKGLEFDTVILAGLGELDDSDEQLPLETRLLYVGMTRAQRQLLVTSSGVNRFTQKLRELVGEAA